MPQLSFAHGEKGKAMPDIKCEHRDDWGFCKKYSNDAVVWKCKEDADCEGYVEAADDE